MENGTSRIRRLEGVNITLKSWNETQELPQVFEANDKWNCIRADRIGDEFGKQYILKAGGNEYQRIKEMADTKATFILPLNFPAAMDVEDPNDARFVSISTLKHWELAPGNPAAFEKAGIPFCITAADLRDSKSFFANLRKAIQYGLSERKALEALTIVPAKIMNVSNQVGTLEAGKLANFLITNGPLFDEKTSINENWIQGNRYIIRDDHSEINGKYRLSINTVGEYAMEVRNPNAASLIKNADTVQGKITFDGTLIKLVFNASKKSKQSLRLSGVVSDSTWSGIAEDSIGNHYSFVANYVDTVKSKTDSTREKRQPSTWTGSLSF